MNHQEYHLFRSSNRRTAAESFAFLTLGIGSPMHSSVHPLSVVLTLTANVNRFACAGPPSCTHLNEKRRIITTQKHRSTISTFSPTMPFFYLFSDFIKVQEKNLLTYKGALANFYANIYRSRFVW